MHRTRPSVDELAWAGVYGLLVATGTLGSALIGTSEWDVIAGVTLGSFATAALGKLGIESGYRRYSRNRENQYEVIE